MRATVEAVERGGLTALMVTHNMQHAIEFRKSHRHDDGRPHHLRGPTGAGEERALTGSRRLVERFHLVDAQDAALLTPAAKTP